MRQETTHLHRLIGLDHQQDTGLLLYNGSREEHVWALFGTPLSHCNSEWTGRATQPENNRVTRGSNHSGVRISVISPNKPAKQAQVVAEGKGASRMHSGEGTQGKWMEVPKPTVVVRTVLSHWRPSFKFPFSMNGPLSDGGTVPRTLRNKYVWVAQGVGNENTDVVPRSSFR